MDQSTRKLKLTDVIDVSTLQDLQDGFAAVAHVQASFLDDQGVPITESHPSTAFLQRMRDLAREEDAAEGPTRDGRVYVAPIKVNGQSLGVLKMVAGPSHGLDEARLRRLARRFEISPKRLRQILKAAFRARSGRPAAIQLLFMLANTIARMSFQEYAIRQHVRELTAVYSLTMMLAEARDLDDLLRRAVRLVVEVTGFRASSIRLIDHERDELVIRAAYNLSDDYLRKGPIRLSKATIDQEALGPAGVSYVADMRSDPRVQYPAESAREGIVSMMSVGMRHRGKSVGVMRVYTDKPYEFSPAEVDLLRAIAAQAAAAIENARLAEETAAAENLERQVRIAAEVQRRMLPSAAPTVPGLDLACVYSPSLELSGDFFDFISLPDQNLGLAIADVAGKGIPASLIMASVRAALRAQVDNVYYLYEIIRRLNDMLLRDTEPHEFVTLFYGVIDVPNRRLTWCDAGHPRPMLLRDGQVSELESLNGVLGVYPQQFQQMSIDLRPGDVLLFYTDGLSEAMNFQQEMYGVERIRKSLLRPGHTAQMIAQNVLWDMRRFAGLARNSDDVTLVVVRVL